MTWRLSKSLYGKLVKNELYVKCLVKSLLVKNAACAPYGRFTKCQAGVLATEIQDNLNDLSACCL